MLTLFLQLGNWLSAAVATDMTHGKNPMPVECFQETPRVAHGPALSPHTPFTGLPWGQVGQMLNGN